MLKVAILFAGLIVCLPALGVALFLGELPGARTAALASFSFIYLPFIVVAVMSNRFTEFFAAAGH
jgi:hypothetical protein